MLDFNKPSTIIILVIVALLIVSGVLFVADRINSNNREMENMADSGVIMTIQNVTPTGLSFVFENPTEKEYIFGVEYSLYVRKNDSWEPVKYATENVGWGLPAQMIAPQDETYVGVDWQLLYGELPAGDYKFQKRISRWHSSGDYILEQEFSIP